MNTFPQKFRFSFVKDGVTTYCKYAPEEWNDNVLKWERDKKNHAIMTKYVNTFSFVLDDAAYLRECFDAVDFQNRIFPEVLFVVEEYNYGTFSYAPYYSANIDFYSYEETLYSVKASTLDIGFKTAFDANYDTTYEIELPSDAGQVEYDRLKMKNMLAVEAAINGNIMATTTDAVIGIDMIVEELTNECFLIEYPAAGASGNETWFLKTTRKTTLSIGGTHKTIATFGAPENTQITAEYKIRRKRGADTTTFTIGAAHMNPIMPAAGGIIHGASVDVEPGDLLYLILTVNTNYLNILKPSGINALINLGMDYYAKDRTVKIRGLRPTQLLSTLISKATDNRYSQIHSPALATGEISNMLITSGDLIRGINNAKIKTSLKDFFESMQAMFGLYYTFDKTGGQETLVVKHINDFYDKNLCLASLSDVKDFKRGVYNDQVYNRLIIGYKDNTYDEINGKYEFNTQLEYSIPTDAKSKELKLVSPYRADAYGIEFLIMDYDKKDTTDSGDDNDVFVLHTGDKVAGTENIYRLNRTLAAPGHLAGNSAFNVFLSPRHCLMRQIQFLKSLFMYSGNNLKFASSAKEFNMTAPDGTREHDDINLNNHNELFRPVQYEFETMVPEGISELMEQSNSGYVEINTNRGVVKGFILSAGENPGRNKSQTWKLLALE